MIIKKHDIEQTISLLFWGLSDKIYSLLTSLQLPNFPLDLFLKFFQFLADIKHTR